MFYKNRLFLRIGDSISQKELLDKLIKLGYKRSTMVSDIGEFSIRGDIADVYSLHDLPLRLEFWGDEIVDIRFFDNETQKSVEKLKEAEILPLYKFIITNEAPKEFSNKLRDELFEEGYFEGIGVYQSYFNKELVSVLDYLSDYIVVYDEQAELNAKLELIEESHLPNVFYYRNEQNIGMVGNWNRGIELAVTDPELLALTGGIVQGMSGAPIIQNGKLIGAVTHVLVNNPARGYGIFIETMLEQ